MKDINKYGLYFLFFLFLSACQNKNSSQQSSSKEQAIQYQLFQLEKKGWKSRKHTQEVDDISFTATQVPIEYYLLKDKGNQDLLLIDSLYNENQRDRVIEFTFEQEEQEDLLKDKFTSLPYEQGIKYLSFSLDQDFYVVTSKKDTIKCAGVNYERNFKIAPYQKVMLFFSGIDPKEKIQLIYQDKLFKKGTLKFQFKDTYTEILL